MLENFVKKKCLENLLREAYDEDTHPGFERHDKFKSALRMKEVADEESDTKELRDELETKNALTRKFNYREYYIWEEFDNFWNSLTDSQSGLQLGMSGKDLGISGPGDPYTYEKIGDDTYRVISGPRAATIGKIFTKKQPRKDTATDQAQDVVQDLTAQPAIPISTKTDQADDNKDMIDNYIDSSGKVIDIEDLDDQLDQRSLFRDFKISSVRAFKNNHKAFKQKAAEAGVTEENNPLLLAAMMAVIEKETRFKLKREIPYDKTSDLKRIRSLFTLRLEDLTDEQLIALKSDPASFFNYVYGDGKPVVVNGVQIPLSKYNKVRGRSFGERNLGNKEPGDGYKYVGRGLNQLTGKANYRKYSKVTGIDLVSNPELLNNLDTAIEVAVTFLINGIKMLLNLSEGDTIPTIKDKNLAIQLAAHANAGVNYSTGSDKVQLAMTNTGREIDNFLVAESELRKIVSKSLLKEVTFSKKLSDEDKENIKYIQKYVGMVKPTGEWTEVTDALFQKFVNDKAKELVYLSHGEFNSPEALKKHGSDALTVATLVSGVYLDDIDRAKKINPFFIKKRRLSKEEQPDQIFLIKQMLMDHDREFGNLSQSQVNTKIALMSKLSTGNQYVYMRGQNQNGTYEPVAPIKNKYFKIFYNQFAFALETKTGNLYYRRRQTDENFSLIDLASLGFKDPVMPDELPSGMGKFLISEATEADGATAEFLKKSYFNIVGPNIQDPFDVFSKSEPSIKNLIIKAINKFNEFLKQKKKDAVAKDLDFTKHQFGKPEELKISFEQIELSDAASVAEDLLADLDEDARGNPDAAAKIVKNVHNIAAKNISGIEMTDAATKFYEEAVGQPRNKSKIKIPEGMPGAGTVINRAWSAWFISRCFEPGKDGFSEIQKLFKEKEPKRPVYQGCCYPFGYATSNRAAIIDDPESFIGQTLLVTFSNQEIFLNDDLDATKSGVLSIVGGSAADPGWDGIASTMKARSGWHMNIKTPSGWIGGNLSGKVSKSSKNDKGAAGYVILVKIKAKE